MSLSTLEKEAMIAISMASGLVSILGSSSILAVLFRSQNKLSTTYRRLMCGISVADLFASLVWIFGDLPAPHGTPKTVFAYGNTVTCTAQGFFGFAGQVGGSLYMCSLCCYYVLTITGYSSLNYDQNVNWKLELNLHAVPILFVTVIGLFLAIEDNFNYSGQVCWIAPAPLLCAFNPNVECDRGEHAMDYRWRFVGYPLFSCFGFIVLSMLFLIWKVKGQWSRTDRYRIERYQQTATISPIDEERKHSVILTSSPGFGTSQQQTRRKNNNSDDVSEAVNQALLYIGAFLLTYSLPIASTIIRTRRQGEPIFVLYLIANLLAPLQGFCNFCIFIRPRLVMLRQTHPNMPFLRLVWTAITSRTETSMLSRRRRRSAQLLANGNRPKRGFTSRELYMQQRANEQGRDDADAVPHCLDYLKRIDEESQNILGNDDSDGDELDDNTNDNMGVEEENCVDNDVSGASRRVSAEDTAHSSGSTKQSEISHKQSQEREAHQKP